MAGSSTFCSTYQVILLGPECLLRAPRFRKEFRTRVRDAGLDPARHIKLIVNPKTSFKPAGVPVFVWCGVGGAKSHPHETVIQTAIRNGNPVYPVVDSLVGYQNKVPKVLTPFNGLEWGRLDELVGHVLHSIGILRRKREVFISYRRADSESIAKQLFSLLNRRGYDVFLDTAEIAPGRDVQLDLKARLADVDLVILLHTTQAFTSAWVYEEILDAQRRGTEVLDVRWWDLDPKLEPKELELAEPFPLLEADLEEQDVCVRGQKIRSSWMLADECLERLLPFIEACRVRSIRTRRDRILKQLCEDAGDLSLTATYLPTGSRILDRVPHVAIELSGTGLIGQVFVSDGTPNAKDMQEKASVLDGLAVGYPATFVYDEFGVLVEDLGHLDWLNSVLRSNPVSRFAAALRLGNAYSWIQNL